MMVERFPFAFDRRYVPVLAAIGVREATSGVAVDDTTFTARFGRWHLATPVTNLRDAQVGCAYRWYRVVGVRVSAVDRGLTFGTTTRAGVCVRFHEPVPVFLGGRVHHPGLTVTVADPEGLAAAVRRRLAR